MGQQKPYEGTRPPSWVNQNNSEFMPMGSIYKGLVKKIDSATRSGRLEVYIEGFSTNTATDPKGWRTVDLCKSIYGQNCRPFLLRRH
jgi:hypothetical protein